MNITNSAAEYIHKVLEKHAPYIFRLTTTPSCCGPIYQLSLGKKQETDRIETFNGIRIALDKTIQDIPPMTIDLKIREHGRELVYLGTSHCNCCL